MKVHEHRDQLQDQIKNAKQEMSDFHEYLISDKFSNGEDWVRTWEVTGFIRRLQHQLEVE